MIGLVAKLESRLPVDAKHCEYAICTGEVCRGSIVLLVDARVRVWRVLRAVLTWLLVLVWTVETALRCELIPMVVLVVAKVMGVEVVVCVGRHVAGSEGISVLVGARHMA